MTIQALGAMISGISSGAENFVQDKVIDFFKDKISDQLFGEVKIPKSKTDLAKDFGKYMSDQLADKLKSDQGK